MKSRLVALTLAAACSLGAAAPAAMAAPSSHANDHATTVAASNNSDHAKLANKGQDKKAPRPSDKPGNGMFRFGIVTDVQYCDCDTNTSMKRVYRDAPAKLTDVVTAFNGTNLAFAMNLGDTIDRDWASYDTIVPIWNQVEAPHYSVLGNHDFPSPDLARAESTLGMPSNYYDFEQQGWRFIVLDTNDISTYEDPAGSADRALADTMLADLKAKGAPNAQSWDGGVGPRQRAWLAGVLADAKAKGQPVIVFGHHPLAPVNQHNAWDDAEVRAVLESQGNVVAYINGHNHEGNYAEINGIQYVNLRGNLQDEYPANAYSIVTVQHNKVTIDGFGEQEDISLTVPKTVR